MLPDRNAAVYWRRRFVALLIGLSVLAVVTWAFAGAFGGGSPAGSPPAAGTSPGVLPSTAASPGGLGASGPAAAVAGAGIRQSGHSAAHAPSTPPCPAGDVVLSLFSSQASYSVRQTPEFEVDVVSTDSRPCTFDIGARHLLLQITAGSSRIWTSADCAEGQASLVARLHRGVPTVVPIAWNGQHSSAGCPVPGAPAAAGLYTATATAAGAQASNALTFRFG
jgi:hypothetical protein